MIKIAPSILSADFANLEKEIKLLETAGADLIHIDVMDGHFVPNLTFGPGVIKAIRPHTKLPFDVHLMITNPENYLDDYIEAGADIITVHVTATNCLSSIIDKLKKNAINAGVAISPSDSPHIIDDVLDMINYILIMTVNPGFSGQSFMRDQLDKIRIISNKVNKLRLPVTLAIDGGINDIVSRECVESGAEVLISGKYIFEGYDYKDRINKLKNIV